MEDGRRQNGKLTETEGEWETDKNRRRRKKEEKNNLRRTDRKMEQETGGNRHRKADNEIGKTIRKQSLAKIMT